MRGALLNSEERRAARRARREAARAAKKAARQADCTLENVADLGNLYKACAAASKGVNWKASTQRYQKDVLRNIVKARRDLLEGNDIPVQRGGRIVYLLALHQAVDIRNPVPDLGGFLILQFGSSIGHLLP